VGVVFGAILWLKPDTIVVYDRAESFTAGREKRFMLMLPAAPTFNGARTTVTTGTQQLVVDTVLPATPLITVDTQIPNGNGYTESAEYEPMTRRLKVDAPGGPAVARFLHVLQGADSIYVHRATVFYIYTPRFSCITHRYAFSLPIHLSGYRFSLFLFKQKTAYEIVM